MEALACVFSNNRRERNILTDSQSNKEDHKHLKNTLCQPKIGHHRYLLSWICLAKPHRSHLRGWHQSSIRLKPKFQGWNKHQYRILESNQFSQRYRPWRPKTPQDKNAEANRDTNQAVTIPQWLQASFPQFPCTT